MNTQSATHARRHSAVLMLCEGALMIALAEILSLYPLYKMAWGGSIDLAMLPIFVFCVRWGFAPGMVASLAHAVLQTLMEGGIAIGWESIIGDFLVAYVVLGFAGLFWRMKGGFFIGTTVGCALRFLVHYVVGATIWASYMPEEFFGMTMTTPWFYSLLYNGFYMAIDMVVCLVIFSLLSKPLGKYFLGQDLR